MTLTLPEQVIKALEGIDHDLSRAVVRLTQSELTKQPHPPAELVTWGRRSVIVVNPTRTLEQRTGVFLVPLSDGRALIAFDDSMTATRLELMIRDALDDEELPEPDARIFESIRDVLKDSRRSRDVNLRHRTILVLESVDGKEKRRRARQG